MISNQDPLRYGAEMKLGLIPTEGIRRSSLPTSYFKVNGRGKCKLENENHYVARYLSSPKLMENASCQP